MCVLLLHERCDYCLKGMKNWKMSGNTFCRNNYACECKSTGIWREKAGYDKPCAEISLDVICIWRNALSGYTQLSITSTLRRVSTWPAAKTHASLSSPAHALLFLYTGAPCSIKCSLRHICAFLFVDTGYIPACINSRSVCRSGQRSCS